MKKEKCRNSKYRGKKKNRKKEQFSNFFITSIITCVSDEMCEDDTGFLCVKFEIT